MTPFGALWQPFGDLTQRAAMNVFTVKFNETPASAAAGREKQSGRALHVAAEPRTGQHVLTLSVQGPVGAESTQLARAPPASTPARCPSCPHPAAVADANKSPAPAALTVNRKRAHGRPATAKKEESVGQVYPQRCSDATQTHRPDEADIRLLRGFETSRKCGI